MAHEAFKEKQASIYANIATAGADLGAKSGIHSDVTDPQGAFLVAWRHPESITGRVEDASVAVAGITSALVYNRANLHTTISDHGLQPNFVVDPDDNPDQAETLDALVKIVRSGIDNAGKHAISDRQISFDKLITNGKSVIAPGEANDNVLDINEAIKAASIAEGFAKGTGLKGAWGSHMTVNRFTEDSSLEAAANVISLLNRIPEIGASVPTAIDIGYLQVSKAGFSYTTHERFTLDRE